MRIAFVVNIFPTLSETFILNQITGLLDLGHDVEIFAQVNPGEEKVHSDVEKYSLMKNTHYFNVPRKRAGCILKALYYMAANFPKHPKKILSFIKLFRYKGGILPLRLLLYAGLAFLDRQFDVIHCHFGPNGIIGSFLKEARIQGSIITMFHGYDARLGLDRGTDIYRHLFQSGSCILANSDYIYKILLSFTNRSVKIVYHPVGVDINRFRCEDKEVSVDRPDVINIITVARLVEEKGIRYGIEAISELLQKKTGVALRYDIVGDGPLRQCLSDMVKRLDLSNVVSFAGALDQDEVIAHMRNSHIFLLPSIAEASPVVLLEAQAMGLPVVATKVGGISQSVVAGKSAFLVAEKDKVALAERLEYLIDRPELWAEIGKCGRSFVERHYNIEQLNKRLIEIYESAINRGRQT